MQAQSADGVIHEFPDGTDLSVVDRVMKSYAADSQKPATSMTPQQMFGGSDAPASRPTQDAAPAANHWAAPTGGEFGDLSAQPWAQGEQPDRNATTAPAAKIADAAIGQTILSPMAQEALDAKQAKGGVGGALAGLGSMAAKGIGTAGAVALGVGDAALRGVQEGVVQTATGLGAPKLGRDIAAYLEVAPMLPHGMSVPHMAEAPTGAAAIAEIGRATDIDGAIAAAGKAAETPAAGYTPVTATQVMGRDNVPIMEAWKRANAENTAGEAAPVAEATPAVEAPPEPTRLGWTTDEPGALAPTEAAPAESVAAEPQPVGAAASSRDTTAGTQFGRTAREIRGQQADMELADLMRTPKPGDSRDIIPGAAQTRAEIELSPNTSREAKGLRQEFRDGFNEHEKQNNEIYHKWVDDVTPSFEQLGTMKDLREAKWKADEQRVWGADPNGAPVSTQPLADYFKAKFSDPIEKANSYLRREFKPFVEALTDGNGNPVVLGAKEMYGLRQEMGRRVKDMATNPELAHVRGQFGELMDLMDNAITSVTPDYKSMLDNYRTASQEINAGERLAQGVLKITNGSDRVITFGRFDAFMKNLWLERHGPNPFAPAKSIPQETWDHLMTLHERLARSASDQELARTRGSDTTQLMMEMMRKGAIGTAHAVVGTLTHGIGNVAIPFVTKQIEQGRQLKRVNQHLNPDLSKYPTPGP